MKQLKLLENIIPSLKKDNEVSGIMLMGSVARGTACLTSDLDLFILLEDRVQRKFLSETVDGILVEYIYSDGVDSLRKLNERDMEVYHYIDSKILYDPSGKLKQLYDYAFLKYNTYKADIKYKKDICYWLNSTKIKIKSAMDNHDILKAGFLAATTSWKVLESIWAINNIPMPPSGSIIPHLSKLTITPGDNCFKNLFTGSNTERIASVLEVIDWSVPYLQSGD